MDMAVLKMNKIFVIKDKNNIVTGKTLGFKKKEFFLGGEKKIIPLIDYRNSIVVECKSLVIFFFNFSSPKTGF